MDLLSGYKTHILAAGAVIAALVAFLAGEMSLAEAVNAALVGAGLSALRLGVSKGG